MQISAMSTARRQKLDFPFASDREVTDMVDAFESCTWPYPRWAHRAHLGVALYYLRQFGFAAALERARYHIPLYNLTCGDPDGYHDTITVLFMRRVDQFLRDNPDVGFAAAIETLATICDMQWPLRYYSPERLWSVQARAGWLEPDRLPLDF